MTKPLDDDWILGVHKAAIEARLANRRDVLLALIDQKITSALPTRSDPSAQILSDLGALNKYGPKDEPLDNAPIAIWLKSAIRLSEEDATEGYLVFQEAFRNLRPQTEPKVNPPVEPKPPPPPPPPPPPKPPWPLIIAIILALSIVGGIVYLLIGETDKYCQEPPPFAPGTAHLTFGFMQNDATASETTKKMSTMLSRYKENGPGWSKAIKQMRMPMPISSSGSSTTSRWQVFFNDASESTGMCKWLEECEKNAPQCKTGH